MGSDDVRVYAVWMPILEHDDEASAAEASSTLIDQRARHFWNPDRAIGRETARVLRVQDKLEIAWDLFLVYGPDASWTAPGMPDPSAWMHRLSAPEDPRWMSVERMQRVVNALRPEMPAK